MLLIIVTFFMPFFSVSCNSMSRDEGIDFSGFELSTGKTVGEKYYSGSFFVFILIIPSFILLVCSVYAYDTKKIIFYNIYKNALFITPVFNIFAGFIVWNIFKITVLKKIPDVPYLNAGTVYSFHIKSGFILYILFSAAVFAFASANYFIKRE